MKSSELLVLLVLLSPVLTEGQEIHRASRSLEEQQAISHISQAEYYTRMALRSLEASETIGKAPYFDYQTAREDIEKVLTEFKIYLKGDEPSDFPPAVPMMLDGRYFAESIKDFLTTHKKEERQAVSNLPTNSAGSRSVESKTPAKTSALPILKESVADKKAKIMQQNSAPVLPSPVLAPSSKTKKEKIDDIVKNGL